MLLGDTPGIFMVLDRYSSNGRYFQSNSFPNCLWSPLFYSLNIWIHSEPSWGQDPSSNTEYIYASCVFSQGRAFYNIFSVPVFWLWSVTWGQVWNCLSTFGILLVLRGSRLWSILDFWNKDAQPTLVKKVPRSRAWWRNPFIPASQRQRQANLCEL